MEQRSRPKHFSMIRGFHLTDFFTLANAACGVGAVFLTMLYLRSGARAHFYAAAMAPIAFFFDWLDGNVARWRHQHSALGRELDSLSERHLLRRRARRAGLCRGPERWLGLRGAHLLCVLRP
jgi:CDP-diacylglycerol--serine O-phosphatidyltransferase